MSRFWRNWLDLWCLAVALFGLVLAGAALEATGGPAGLLLSVMGNQDIRFDAPLRFSTALMGCVTFGWSVTFYAAFQAAHALGENGRPIWRLITLGAAAWYLIDSAASIATGFALNAVSNTALLAAYLIPLLATGALSSTQTTNPNTIAARSG